MWQISRPRVKVRKKTVLKRRQDVKLCVYSIHTHTHTHTSQSQMTVYKDLLKILFMYVPNKTLKNVYNESIHLISYFKTQPYKKEF